jgi:hypothetical protein
LGCGREVLRKFHKLGQFQNETIFLSPQGAMGLKGREAAATAAEPPKSPVFCGEAAKNAHE